MELSNTGPTLLPPHSLTQHASSQPSPATPTPECLPLPLPTFPLSSLPSGGLDIHQSMEHHQSTISSTALGPLLKFQLVNSEMGSFSLLNLTLSWGGGWIQLKNRIDSRLQGHFLLDLLFYISQASLWHLASTF